MMFLVFSFSGLIGLTAAVTVDSENDPCTNGYSIFSNLNYYKDWILNNMRGSLKTCTSDELDIRVVTDSTLTIIFS